MKFNLFRIILLCLLPSVGLAKGWREKTQAELTKEDIEEFVHEARVHAHKIGIDKFRDEVTNRKSEFHKGELYIFVIGFDGMNMGHGLNKALVGRKVLGAKDKHNKFLVAELLVRGNENRKKGMTKELESKIGGPVTLNEDVLKKATFSQMPDNPDKKLGDGWVEYTWMHPVEKKMRKKLGYSAPLNDKYIIGSGFYPPEKK